MPDERAFTLRQIDQARGDLYAIADRLEFIESQLSPMPTRAWMSHSLLWATAPTWLLLAAACCCCSADDANPKTAVFR
jgi:hypothetical protein